MSDLYGGLQELVNPTFADRYVGLFDFQNTSEVGLVSFYMVLKFLTLFGMTNVEVSSIAVPYGEGGTRSVTEGVLP